MHAAMVEDFTARLATARPPAGANQGEVLLQVRAAALSNLVRSQANGSHYSSLTTLPFTPGNDGVGVAEDGARVYFISPRAPFGSMAEYAVVSRSMTIPCLQTSTMRLRPRWEIQGLRPGAPFWEGRSSRPVKGPDQRGDRDRRKQAIQVAKYLGASKIIATGRNEQALAELAVLGADETISLSQPEEDLLRSFRSALSGVQVVLDYLWGPSAELILKARGRPWIAGRSAAHPFCPDRIDQWKRDHLICRAAAQLRC